MAFMDFYRNAPDTPPPPAFKDLPDSKSGIYAKLLEVYMTHDSIKRTAQYVWESEDRPDGDEVNKFGIKNKDRHWWIAKMILEMFADMDADFLYRAKILKDEALCLSQQAR